MESSTPEITAFVYRRLGWEMRDTVPSADDRIRLSQVPKLDPLDDISPESTEQPNTSQQP